jgi:methylisocitrate lyase
MTPTPGQRFRAALDREKPLQIAGTINAFTALLAERAGFQAIYLSGAGVANASHGLPDLGVTDLHDVLEDIRRITSATSLPLLVDVDTGWGSALSIERTTKELIRAGAAALHIEDQISAKRCGHRPGKALVDQADMCDRVSAVAQSRTDKAFYVIARTDAIASEGIDAAIMRASAYVAAGADAIFAEAVTSLNAFRRLTQEIKAPILANITEFGQTPLLTRDELAQAQVAMALYPLSAFRAMNAAAQRVYKALRDQGTQAGLLDQMMTRQELYEVLGYQAAEQRIDELIHKQS